MGLAFSGTCTNRCPADEIRDVLREQQDPTALLLWAFLLAPNQATGSGRIRRPVLMS